MLSRQAGRPHCADIEHVKTDNPDKQRLVPTGLSETVGAAGKRHRERHAADVLRSTDGHSRAPKRNSGECFVFDSCTLRMWAYQSQESEKLPSETISHTKHGVLDSKQACIPPPAVAFTGHRAWSQFLQAL